MNTKATAHTPTPRETFQSCRNILAGSRSRHVRIMADELNTACNAHEELVFALRQIATYVGVNEMNVAPAIPVAPYEMQKIARAALSKAGA